ncbi:hypothetical protein D7B24_008174 [Verticillium nonalfalfae]|uniref:Uncharacterized protein n=1 Tax=Verticillium nonalfalfae TaxID=1051616 RepID=A0A3M9Y7L5_9PEZI|nr:uncharacterized protein D7B24_008174 [Verticillium nonalfalfae]RNJ55746.1 hypothetical protein D7B24_008174 [Verticillium nonalfalfae]
MADYNNDDQQNRDTFYDVHLGGEKAVIDETIDNAMEEIITDGAARLSTSERRPNKKKSAGADVPVGASENAVRDLYIERFESLDSEGKYRAMVREHHDSIFVDVGSNFSLYTPKKAAPGMISSMEMAICCKHQPRDENATAIYGQVHGIPIQCVSGSKAHQAMAMAMQAKSDNNIVISIPMKKGQSIENKRAEILKFNRAVAAIIDGALASANQSVGLPASGQQDRDDQQRPYVPPHEHIMDNHETVRVRQVQKKTEQRVVNEDTHNDDRATTGRNDGEKKPAKPTQPAAGVFRPNKRLIDASKDKANSGLDM